MREWSCCWRQVGLVWFCCFSFSITSTMFVVFTICGHMRTQACPFPRKHKGYDVTMKRPTWLYRGFASYEQTEWLRITLLVKRISSLVSQNQFVGRHAAMTLQEEDPAGTQKAVCGNSLYLSLPSPATALCKKDISRKRPTWLVQVSRLYVPRANWVVVYHTLNVRSQQQGINFDDGWSF